MSEALLGKILTAAQPEPSVAGKGVLWVTKSTRSTLTIGLNETDCRRGLIGASWILLRIFLDPVLVLYLIYNYKHTLHN